ncbi:methylated-DNA--protein-cysteine methyltransferase [Chanos chanos]|uniref:Methylated-DNA--protein-cysteine methyltransferase n=1 Tax=Chanos chanos TaxID=29144 RepID=A0A6J2WE55_CHACN|nr:methylated-DNA--protein-cysteine methyltransferase [Chanos chanos]
MRMAGTNSCLMQTAFLHSPVGQIELCGCEKGLHNIQLNPHSKPSDSASQPCVLSDGQVELNSELQRCVKWLQSYFSEAQSVATLPLPTFHHPILHGDSFTARVLWTLFRQVSVGETVSYKRLAEMAGNPRAIRAVGGAMRRNPIPLLIPCHRVLPSSGQTGLYMGGKGNHIKEWLLTHESVQKGRE